MTTAATMPAEATAPAGPPTRAQWLHDMCTAASRANCGHCWTAPGPPCVTADATGTPGYLPARFRGARFHVFRAWALHTLPSRGYTH